MRRWDVQEIVQAVGAVAEVPPAEILGKSRKQCFVILRFAVVHIALQQKCPLSLPGLGRRIGRDHTTVLHARDKAARRYREDVEFRWLVDHSWRYLETRELPEREPEVIAVPVPPILEKPRREVFDEPDERDGNTFFRKMEDGSKRMARALRMAMA